MKFVRSNDFVQENGNGGVFVEGRRYALQKQIDVINAHCKLTMENPNKVPSTREVDVEARVSHKYTSRVVGEFWEKGFVKDPALGSLVLRDKHKLYRKVGPEESLFLLACCV
jgi:hypothetical protein